MQSIVPGYTYDIFVSYRQKDNKYDGWVTEFVANLKKELEATFKEDVSVYFDINPHDGLLETHDVDASLKEKLKCLVFIPIISRTYCDPKSFAWENEFKAFIEQASQDQFGLKVKLLNGNVSNRVLPIRIYDLEADDIKLCESVLGGVLRGIEFIYKEPGVNRPLKSDDDEKINLNKTKYRNQINKVANAIKEIITGIGQYSPHQKEVSKEILTTKSVSWNNRKTRIIAGSIIALALIISGLMLLPKLIKPKIQTDKSIAVLPFANDSPDKENEYFCNGMMDEILNQLQKLKELKVKSRTSVEKYRNSNKDIKEIGKELGAAYVMEGSVRKIGNDLRIAAQLIDSKTGDHLWSEVYKGKYTTDIFDFQSSVAERVAASLGAVIAPAEKERIESKPTTDMRAHDLVMRAGDYSFKAIWKDSSTNVKYNEIALNLLNQALKIDPLYVDALRAKADLLAFNMDIWPEMKDSVMIYFRKVLELDPKNPYIHLGIAQYYNFLESDSTEYYFKKAYDYCAKMPMYYFYLSQHLLYHNNDVIGTLKSTSQGILLLDDPAGRLFSGQLANIFTRIGDFSRSLNYRYKSLYPTPECYFIYPYISFLANEGKYTFAHSFLDSICGVNQCDKDCLASKFALYAMQKDSEKARQYLDKLLKSGYIKGNNLYDVFIANYYQETGRKKEAISVLNEFIRIHEKNGHWMVRWPVAIACAMLGDNKKAIEIFSKLQKEGFIEWVYSPETFPGLDNLRKEPEFKEIYKRIQHERDSLQARVREMEQSGEIRL